MIRHASIKNSNDSSRDLNADHCEVIPFADADETLFREWERIRNGNHSRQSPYFHPAFSRAAANARDDVRLAVYYRANRVAAILPFQSIGQRQIGPVGGRLNDVHGVISNDIRFEQVARDTLQKTNASLFSFHALKDADDDSSQFKFRQISSYFLDLSLGWKDYSRWVRYHSSTIRRQGQKNRAMVRDFGPVRFEFDVQDEKVLDQLITFKRSKYQRTKTFDILSVPWAVDLLRHVYATREPGFRGVLSALWAGDDLAAVHFGMLSGRVLHYWFPVFSNRFAKYSPGTQLLLRVGECAAAQGINKLDLGCGDDPYKLKFANGVEPLDCGTVTNSRVIFCIAQQRYQIRNRLKQIPLKPLAKTVLRAVYPDFGEWNYR